MFAAASLFSTTARANALDDLVKSGVLKVAVPQDFPIFGSVTSANRAPYLQTKKVDLITSSLCKNLKRRKVIPFSEHSAPFYNGVFGAADPKVTSAADLAAKIVSMTHGAVEDLELTRIAPTSATIKRYEYNNGTISPFLFG